MIFRMHLHWAAWIQHATSPPPRTCTHLRTNIHSSSVASAPQNSQSRSATPTPWMASPWPAPGGGGSRGDLSLLSTPRKGYQCREAGSKPPLLFPSASPAVSVAGSDASHQSSSSTFSVGGAGTKTKAPRERVHVILCGGIALSEISTTCLLVCELLAYPWRRRPPADLVVHHQQASQIGAAGCSSDGTDCNLM